MRSYVVLPCWLLREDVAAVVRAAAIFTSVDSRGVRVRAPLRWHRDHEAIYFFREA